MNDQPNAYDPYGQQPPQPRIIGYDAYGQPVFEQPQGHYDPYGQQNPGQGYGHDPRHSPQPQQYDPYGAPPPQPGPDGGQGYGQGQTQAYPQSQDQWYAPDQPQGYAQGRTQGYAPDQTRGHAQGQGGHVSQDTGYDPGHARPAAHDAGDLRAAVDTAAPQWNIPHQQSAPAAPFTPSPDPASGTGHPAGPDSPAVPGAAPRPRRSGRRAGGDTAAPGAGTAGADTGPPSPSDSREAAGRSDYRTEQFAFTEEPDEDSEDVIDWLKFTESRSERREEAKRRGRNRVVALGVVLALALLAGVGYLWSAGSLPGAGDGGKKNGTTATGPQKRDVIVLHLHNTKKKGTSTALLVNNTTTGRATTVLLPDSLSVANDDGTVSTLAESVEDDGSEGTRNAIGTLFGARISGTWRLDTPFLENLVELVGRIDITTDATVPGTKEGDPPLVKKGENQTLNGRAAAAYATHLGSGEKEDAQLQRFGQVMEAVLKKFPSDAKSATVTVETLAQILEPPLTEKDLGASLAKLAEHAKGGDHEVALLPVEAGGALSPQAAGRVVKDILGGSVTAPERDAAVRIGIRNATGETKATEAARVRLVNGGYTVIDSGGADTAGTSRITYGDESRKAEAAEVAKTLGLPPGAVAKGEPVANADISVTLGQDFKTD
ncbi:LytR C-terminal domain-containing protein [Streptomyces sp. CAU 1734]|uniref:LCP family protein n=1 Tax=Streptomyces sp. CAU 1734 TaxID=3140360 RepID=UPI003261A667